MGTVWEKVVQSTGLKGKPRRSTWNMTEQKGGGGEGVDGGLGGEGVEGYVGGEGRGGRGLGGDGLGGDGGGGEHALLGIR